MRDVHSSFRLLAVLAAMTVVTGCGGGAEKTGAADSAAAAAAAAPPPPESFALAGEDGSWTGDISSAGIVFRRKGKDSLMFEFKAPNVSGAISDYESLLTAKDTVRIAISLAMTKCTDKAGTEYTHMAQVWLTGDVTLQTKGCANKK